MDIAKVADSVIARFIGTKHERDVKKLQPLVVAINEREAEIKSLSDDELKARFLALKDQVQEPPTGLISPQTIQKVCEMNLQHDPSRQAINLHY